MDDINFIYFRLHNQTQREKNQVQASSLKVRKNNKMYLCLIKTVFNWEK